MTLKQGRHPVDAGADNRQMVWEALRALAGEWAPVSIVSEDIGVIRKTAMDYLNCLAAGGIVEQRRDEGRYGTTYVRLVKDMGHHAPRLRRDGTPVTQGGGVTNMWRSMRALGTFNALDIALHSSTPTTPVAEASAQSYCSMLLATGFLRVMQKADPVKGRKARYRLIRNDGPRPPMVQRVKQIYDPNTGKVYRKAGQE